jgi:hypothetical protein
MRTHSVRTAQRRPRAAAALLVRLPAPVHDTARLNAAPMIVKKATAWLNAALAPRR